jgi:hypothetical protein
MNGITTQPLRGGRGSYKGRLGGVIIDQTFLDFFRNLSTTLDIHSIDLLNEKQIE